MSPKVFVALGAALAIGVAGFAGGREFAQGEERGRLERCAAGLKENTKDKCPTQIVDALTSLELDQATRGLAVRDEVIVVAGQSRAADLAELERLRADLAALQAAPVTAQCAAAPAMTAVREQLCREVGGEGCEP